MSRFSDDGESELPYEFWQQAAKRAVHGSRGQQALRDLEAALLAMPEKRLLYSAISNGKDCGCALGVLAAHKQVQTTGCSWSEAFARLPFGDDDWNETVRLGVQFGLRKTVASLFAEWNDEGIGKLTPEYGILRSAELTDEQRYDMVLAKVREQMRRSDLVPSYWVSPLWASASQTASREESSSAEEGAA